MCSFSCVFVQQLPRHYLQFPDGFILVYDPCDSTSLDMLAGIKADIDKNKDKKEVSQTFGSLINAQQLINVFIHRYAL